MIISRAVGTGSPVSVSTMSTMLPFLYQTRTLSSLSYAKACPKLRIQFKTPIVCRGISTSLRTRSSDNTSDSSATTNVTSTNESIPSSLSNRTILSDQPPQQRFHIRRTTNMHGSEPPPVGSWDLKPDKELSYEDNFHMQNPIHVRRYWDRYFEQRREESDAEFLAPQESIEFEEDLEDLNVDSTAGDEIQSLTKSYSMRESTITDSERHAFQRIFENILTRPRPLSGTAPSEYSGNSVRDFGTSKAEVKLFDILTSAVSETQSKQDIEEAVNRYPPALRPAAARAFGLIQSKRDEQDIGFNEPEQRERKAAQLETLRAPERRRVGDLMREAETDFDLWDVLEKEVFPLIKSLGLEETAKTKEELIVPASKNKKRNKSKKRAEETNQAKTEFCSEETLPEDKKDITEPQLYLASMAAASGLPPLAVYAPLYSEYLLLGLRLLDRSFSRPSCLTFSILPKIKTLGFISHVLGGSTQLYNELLNIHRFRLDDFRGMLQLLEEMEHSAIDFDEDTLDIVSKTVKSQEDALRGYSGQAIQALWSLPEFEYTRFRKWKEHIKTVLQERDLEKDSLENM